VTKSPGLAVGVDIIEIQRIEQAIASWKNAFLERIYTRTELEHYRNRTNSLAARFAGKEAVMKTLGIGATGIKWQDIEILSNANGAPLVNLYGKAKNKAREIGITELAISLSHSKRYAVAFVVGNAV
jgi:holo-[acyl-carrier protein] synthase